MDIPHFSPADTISAHKQAEQLLYKISELKT